MIAYSGKSSFMPSDSQIKFAFINEWSKMYRCASLITLTFSKLSAQYILYETYIFRYFSFQYRKSIVNNNEPFLFSSPDNNISLSFFYFFPLLDANYCIVFPKGYTCIQKRKRFPILSALCGFTCRTVFSRRNTKASSYALEVNLTLFIAALSITLKIIFRSELCRLHDSKMMRFKDALPGMGKMI